MSQENTNFIPSPMSHLTVQKMISNITSPLSHITDDTSERDFVKIHTIEKRYQEKEMTKTMADFFMECNSSYVYKREFVLFPHCNLFNSISHI